VKIISISIKELKIDSNLLNHINEIAKDNNTDEDSIVNESLEKSLKLWSFKNKTIVKH
jgi:hypothetical protein